MARCVHWFRAVTFMKGALESPDKRVAAIETQVDWLPGPSLDIPSADREKICSGNAVWFFGL